jgi:hypothetical protein
MDILCDTVSEIMENFINHLNSLTQTEKEIFLVNLNIIFSTIEDESFTCSDIIEFINYAIKKQKMISKVIEDTYFNEALANKTTNLSTMKTLINIY